MKLIFLDIDGVLISLRHWERRKSAELKDKADPECVRLLNRLIADTGAKIVVSSTWRKIKNRRRQMKFLRDLLAAWGVKGEVIGATPELERDYVITGADGTRIPMAIGAQRGIEIQHWLDHCGREIESFVMLDDEDDMLHLRPFLVQTTFDLGIEPKHVEKAKRILMKQ